MFTAEGYIGRDAYTAVVGRDDVTEADNSVGLVTGSPNIVALLRLHTGQRVSVTATGPVVTVDPVDPDSVMAALMGLTQVVRTTGDVPDILGPDVAGADY